MLQLKTAQTCTFSKAFTEDKQNNIDCERRLEVKVNDRAAEQAEYVLRAFPLS